MQIDRAAWSPRARCPSMMSGRMRPTKTSLEPVACSDRDSLHQRIAGE